jgi:hypothetical protein
VTLHLVAPGLLGPLPRDVDPSTLPRPRRLETLLARADTAEAPSGCPPTLFRLFGIDPAAAGGAACSYLAEFDEPPRGWLSRADPVHLVPDQDRLLLFDLQRDAVTAAEARELTEAFNAHFADDGLVLTRGPAGGWYLLAETRTAVRLHDLDDVVGRNLDGFLPEGPDADFWRRLLNEAQMLCHGLACNARREAAGALPISGLWFSGGGALPAVPGPAPIRGAAGAGYLLAGLCRIADVPRVEADEVLRDGGLLLFDGAHRPVLDADAIRWGEAVGRFERLLTGAAGGALELHPCNGRRYRLVPGHRFRWWKRRRPLSARLDAP